MIDHLANIGLHTAPPSRHRHSQGVPGPRILDALDVAHGGSAASLHSGLRPYFALPRRGGGPDETVEPGSPCQNGYCESFNGKFRDECLNMEVFHHPDHARAVIELWRRYYNAQRPHSSLGYRTPREFRASLAKDGGCAADGCTCSPPEDTGPVMALSSGGGGLNAGAGADMRGVPARAYGS